MKFLSTKECARNEGRSQDRCLRSEHAIAHVVLPCELYGKFLVRGCQHYDAISKTSLKELKLVHRHYQPRLRGFQRGKTRTILRNLMKGIVCTVLDLGTIGIKVYMHWKGTDHLDAPLEFASAEKGFL